MFFNIISKKTPANPEVRQAARIQIKPVMEDSELLSVAAAVLSPRHWGWESFRVFIDTENIQRKRSSSKAFHFIALVSTDFQIYHKGQKNEINSKIPVQV